jgi:hypothetical protein
MKFIILASLLISASAWSQRGLDPSGPDTMNHPANPSSGPTRSRSDDMLGKDISPTAQTSDYLQEEVSPADMNTSPTETPGQKNQSEAFDETLQTGPYRQQAEEREEDLEKLLPSDERTRYSEPIGE